MILLQRYTCTCKCKERLRNDTVTISSGTRVYFGILKKTKTNKAKKHSAVPFPFPPFQWIRQMCIDESCAVIHPP